MEFKAEHKFRLGRKWDCTLEGKDGRVHQCRLAHLMGWRLAQRLARRRKRMERWEAAAAKACK